jgi:hypothetical protein
MPTKYETTKQLAHGVLTGVQKARSTASELCGEDLARELEPGLWDDGPMGLMTVAVMMTGKVDDLTASDVANLMYFVHRDVHTLLAVGTHPAAMGMEPFPTTIECLERWL